MTMPRESLAAVLVDYDRPLEVRPLPVPDLEPGGILVAVEASTVCGGDVHTWKGHNARTGLPQLPLVLGHEIIGRVVALGAERTVDSLGAPLAEGDRVAWPYAWCGTCYWCTIAKQPTQCANARMYGWGPVDRPPYLTGGFSQYAYVMPRCGVVRVPDELDPGVAASATCALRTVVHGFEKLGRIESSDTVVIQGSGPVGLYALAHAIQSGAAQTIVLGAPAERLAIARRWGADLVLDVTTTTPAERLDAIRDLTDGRGADLAVEASGTNAAFAEGLEIVRRGGRFLVIGAAGQERVPIQVSYVPLRELSILGVMSADVSHYYRALRFVQDNADRFSFGDLIGGTYALDRVEEALAAVADQREVKPVVAPWGATTITKEKK